MSAAKVVRIALAGNPNSGKTTIFNALTGSNQKTGNYAGVTVEKKEGRKVVGDIEFIIYDLPGIYSLTAYSLDEVVARDFVLNEKPDVIIDVLDATNIERNLYLCLQFQELGVPIVSALNIIDQAESRGIRIDDNQLSKILGIPIIRTVGTKGKGMDKLLDAAVKILDRPDFGLKQISYGEELEIEISRLVESISAGSKPSNHRTNRWLAIKLLEKDLNAKKRLSSQSNGAQVEKILTESIRQIENHFGRDSEMVVSEQRYAYVHGAVAEAVTKSERGKQTLTEVIDKILINRFFGVPIFLFILWGIFQTTFTLGAYPMGWLENLFAFLSAFVSSIVPEGILHSLLVDGIIGGVGGVLNFVPLIAILFLFISILEDSGYMARVAFIMDRFLHIFGLHGQSFLPMMVGFGCSVPAVMAARALKNPRDRIITILVTPFMSCGAKLPVYVLLTGAFFPNNPSNMIMLVYLIGVALAMLSSLLYRKTVLRGEDSPFV
ncbi:MAG: ferrous iron transport protein B, partial [Pseudomonadota bacterium]